MESGQKVMLTHTNIINDRRLIGKKAVVDLILSGSDMAWIKVGRVSRCVPRRWLKEISNIPPTH